MLELNQELSSLVFSEKEQTMLGMSATNPTVSSVSHSDMSLNPSFEADNLLS